MSNFHHDNLVEHTDSGSNTIRLLSISPGSGLEPIQAELHYTVLEEAAPYEALSYCWGDVNKLVDITLNGKPFRVTPNLQNALFALRRTHDIRIVWVDAICINQNNIEERNHQVSIMRDIYTRAQRTIIWPGKLSANIRQLKEILNQLKSLVNYFDLSSINDLSWNEAVDLYEKYGLPLPNDNKWEGLRDLLSSSWYTRKWVIQEITVARDVSIIAESEEIDWEHMSTVAKNILTSKALKELVPCDFSQHIILDGFRKHFQVQNGLPLLLLLENFRNHQATDPRDHVFALCGLMEDQSILPEYDSSVVQVYTSTAKMITARTQSLECFNGVYGVIPSSGSASSNDVFDQTSLPSWVTDWNTNEHPLPITFSGLKIFCASKSTKYTAQWPEAPGDITVQGMIVDKIVAIGNPFPDNPTGITMFNFLQWKSMARELTRDAYPEKQDFKRDFCLTLLAGTGIGIPQREASGGDFIILKGFLKHLKWCNWTGDRIDEWGQDKFHAVNLVNRLGLLCQKRVLVVTESGRMGLVPKRAEIGDALCLMMGADFPFVARPTGNNTWNLIGHSYVHGIMKGEIFDEDECENMVLV